MTDKITTTIYCVLLFLSGSVFGFIFSKDGQIGLVSFLSASSSIATVATAVVALVALNSWKHQFKLQKRYDAVMELRSHALNASPPLVYLNSMCEHFSHYLRSRDDNALAELYPYEIQREWFVKVNEMTRTWNVVSILLSDLELSMLPSNPMSLEKMVRDVVNEMMQMAVGEDRKSLLSVHQAGSQGAVKVEKAFSDFEQRCRDLLKHISK